MGTPSSMLDLARGDRHSVAPGLRGMFEVECLAATKMHMSDRAWAEAGPVLRAPREEVGRQWIVLSRDLVQGTEAVYNPLRGRRSAATATAPAGPGKAEPDATGPTCDWCLKRTPGHDGSDLAEDEFGAIHSADGRVRAGANWARQAPVSGIVFGDAAMHDLLALSGPDFCSLFEVAGRYVAAAHAADPRMAYFEVFINGGARSAASVQHAHAQAAGRAGRHFAWPEAVASRGAGNYWQTVQAVHQDLGLAAEFDGGTAWASLVPVKERDITAVSASLVGGAAMMYRILQALFQRGTNAYSLAAILAPVCSAGHPPPARFRDWPPVVWRLIDRGDARVRHADIGCLELFGSSVVSTDPFEVAGWLRQAAAEAGASGRRGGRHHVEPLPVAAGQQEDRDAGHLP